MGRRHPGRRGHRRTGCRHGGDARPPQPPGTVKCTSNLVRKSTTHPSHSTSVSPPPAATGGLPGLPPFVREWDGMRESVVIDRTGHGHFHYMMACASCSMADMPEVLPPVRIHSSRWVRRWQPHWPRRTPFSGPLAARTSGSSVAPTPAIAAPEMAMPPPGWLANRLWVGGLFASICQRQRGYWRPQWMRWCLGGTG